MALSDRAIRLERDSRIRERSRRTIGAQQTEVSFAIPVSGEANSGLVMFPTDSLHFNVAYYPKQGERKAIPPVVRSGFNLELADPQTPLDQALGLMGVVNIPRWVQNDDGFYVGAVAHVGVVHLGVFTSPPKYKGFIYISFVGLASQGPEEDGDYEFRRDR